MFKYDFICIFSVILNATQYFSQSLSEHFLQNGDFDSQVRDHYVFSLVKFSYLHCPIY